MTIWLDYRKTFNSVSYSWLLKSLQLAKAFTAPDVAAADAVTECLTKTWLTILALANESRKLFVMFRIFQKEYAKVTICLRFCLFWHLIQSFLL